MAGTNLVRTTLTGVRPLGVRGEPLHQAHEQIRGVVRRRLGERHARLLAEPQPDETGRRIDWYTDLPGTIVPFAELAPERKASLLAEIETLSGDIATLAASLKAAPSDDAQLTGRALELTGRRPSDDYIFLVGDQPVIVAWGYEPDAASSLLPPPMVPAAAAPAAAVAAPIPATVLATGPVALAAAAPFGWLRWLLIGLFAILLALIASYFLRQCSPVGPDVAVTQLPPPPAPPAPPPPPDPSVGLNKDLGAAQADETKLRATLASLRDELKAKRADCKPPEPPKPPPKPPQVVEKKPDPPKPPPKPPQVAAKKPDPPKPPPVPTPPPGDDRMRMPKSPTNDYSFLQGCWRTDTFKHGPQIRPGYTTYCFDSGGNGSMEFRFDNGVTCRAPATARFNGGQLAVVDADANCSPRGRWAQDRLYCQPGADGVAFCTGSNRTERWTVNLHRVR
ncbi:MAG: SrfA family protein [Reyranellaceae bacterium]